MLDVLRGGPQPVAVLGTAAGLAQPQASKHLRVLREAGLVGVSPDGQRRLYALRPAPLLELDGWLQQYRDVLEANYARLDGLLARGDDSPKPSPTPRKTLAKRKERPR
jgi:DNA-binding transcriptional ArsR family regulator